MRLDLEHLVISDYTELRFGLVRLWKNGGIYQQVITFGRLLRTPMIPTTAGTST